MDYKSPLSKKKRKEDVTFVLTRNHNIKMALKVLVHQLGSQKLDDLLEFRQYLQETLGEDILVEIHQEIPENFQVVVCLADQNCRNQVINFHIYWGGNKIGACFFSASGVILSY